MINIRSNPDDAMDFLIASNRKRREIALSITKAKREGRDSLAAILQRFALKLDNKIEEVETALMKMGASS